MIYSAVTVSLVAEAKGGPFVFWDDLPAACRAAQELGYDAILSDTNYDPRRTREAAERMMKHKVRGVAVMTSEISLRLIHELARRTAGQLGRQSGRRTLLSSERRWRMGR